MRWGSAMSDDRSSLDVRPSERLGAVTLLDLMALVAGVAFVLPLPEVFHVRTSSIPWTEPWTTFLRVGDFTSRAGIALVPVVLVRHLRSGRMFRPAEWLLVINA